MPKPDPFEGLTPDERARFEAGICDACVFGECDACNAIPELLPCACPCDKFPVRPSPSLKDLRGANP